MDTKEEKKDFEVIFKNERSEWKEKIQILSSHLKDIRTVSIAQVDLFTQRQILLEYSHELAIIISKLNRKIKTQKAEKMKSYSEGKQDYRYSTNEKNILIDGDLSQLNEKAELVENHRKFIEQTVQTVDHMLFSIKNRIALEDFLRGSAIK